MQMITDVNFSMTCALMCFLLLKCVISRVCVCRFRTCLKMADTGPANLIGKLFFNIVQTKCFVLKPEKLCVKRSWWGKCLKHAYRKQAYLRDNVPYWGTTVVQYCYNTGTTSVSAGRNIRTKVKVRSGPGLLPQEVFVVESSVVTAISTRNYRNLNVP
jgi:hypothetical protein